MKLKHFCLIKIIFLILYIVMFSIISFIYKNIYFVFIPQIIIIMYIFDKKYKNHVCFIIFMIFYGLFNRYFFFVLNGINYNPVFIMPLMYSLLFIDEIYFYIKKIEKKYLYFVFLYLAIPIVYIFIPDFSQIVPSSISYIAMIVPIFYVFLIKENKLLLKILIWVFPVIIVYSIFQYFEIFLFFDNYWFTENSQRMTTMYLGANFRPFASFASPEEFGQFLTLFLIIPFYYRRKTFYIYGIISSILLFIFSYRLPLLTLLLFLFVYLLKNKKIREVVLAASLIILIIIIMNIINFNTMVGNKEKGISVSVKHSLSPLKNIFKSYSFNRRIGVYYENYKVFLKNPLGTSLLHNNKISNNKYNNYGSESSAITLILSCGIVMLLYLLIVYYSLSKKIILEKFNFNKSLLLISLIFITFAHGLTLHFMILIYYGAIIRSLQIEDA